MSFFKHVGKANGKKVIIVQRRMPGEEHMAAVLYSEILPSRFHEDVMKLLESVEGQASHEFKDLLGRRMSSNGENLLQVLSQEGFIKKVSCNAVIVQPNSKSSIRLDELNKLLASVGEGKQAVARLEEMDAQAGFADPIKKKEAAYNNSLGETAEFASEDGIGEVAPAAPAPKSDLETKFEALMNMTAKLAADVQEMKANAPKRRASRKSSVDSA